MAKSKVKLSTKSRQLKVYVFGNENLDFDNNALAVAKGMASMVRNDEIEFIIVKPNEDLPFDDGQNVIIMDAVDGLTEAKLIDGDELDRIILPPRNTTHDFDLGFQLKYLKKLGKLGRVTLIGLPMSGKINYNRIHSIFKKLVAQDMQGS